jgi:hypothetical protein
LVCKNPKAGLFQAGFSFAQNRFISTDTQEKLDFLLDLCRYVLYPCYSKVLRLEKTGYRNRFSRLVTLLEVALERNFFRKE